jgi:Fe-S-cluster containining protein
MKKFICRRCGNCCRWEGCVKVNDQEVDDIAAFLGFSSEDFIDKFTRLTPDRQHLSLLEKADGSCQWFSEEGELPACLIDPVKPRQCRDFPIKWNFPDWQKKCRGVFEEE